MAATGAIAEAWIENGSLGGRVIGHGRPRGICGSGLVDAAAPILGRIEPVRTLEVAVGDAVWVQESAPNDRRGRAGEDCIGRARRVEQRPELPLDFEGRHAVAF